jgi:hypothetical protein
VRELRWRVITGETGFGSQGIVAFVAEKEALGQGTVVFVADKLASGQGIVAFVADKVALGQALWICG